MVLATDHERHLVTYELHDGVAQQLLGAKMLFESQQQNAYYYFAKVLEQDPTRWLVLLLTGLCVLLSLALPAAMETPRELHGN